MNSHKLCFYNIPVYILLIIPLLMVNSIYAQENDDCLMCHGDNTLTGKKDGKAFSVFVDGKKLASSVHSGIQCIDCHADLAGPISRIKLM